MRVLTQISSGKSVTVDAKLSDTIETLKTKLNEVEFLDALNQRLVFQGKECHDYETLKEIGYQQNCALNLLVRVQGGVIEPSLILLAQKYNCDKKVCRKCYARLPIRATNCRKKNVVHSSDLRLKKKSKYI
ncbi:hypothetical protein RND71_043881 [Anisodus tanguticus]|uniref:Ubiquitin-like domain-containing protein n=1 Tax=Anisodus tanguticus TaxID=243964 RepID=A0AAE1QRV8_9SOLA|nr:hypothetical protein RND71_043881 [Anisodus tanguticus]